MTSSSIYSVRLPRGKSQALRALWKVNETILSSVNFEKLTEEVVNAVLKELNYLKLGYRICVLTLIDKKAGIIRRVSFSPTPEALEILRRAKVHFREIKIPLTTRKNILVKAVLSKKPQITHNLSDVVYPAKTWELWQTLQKKVGIKTSLVFPLIVRNESIGAMIFSLSKSEKQINDQEKEILVGFTNTVAIAVENASLYRRLKKVNKRLKELSELKDEFVSLTSHELRTPLTAIAGSISTVLDGYVGKISTEAKEFLQGSLNENLRLIRLVNNLLNISRIEAGRLKYEITTFDLSDLINEAVDTFKGQAQEKSLNLNFNCQSNLLVKADKDKAREILLNLIGNAVKYTDKGKVTVTACQQKGVVMTQIEDTGAGISTEDQQRLFQKFQRVGEDGLPAGKAGKRKAGTGLGLYISKIMAEGMAGSIWLKSKPGVGSTFYFSLPQATT